MKIFRILPLRHFLITCGMLFFVSYMNAQNAPITILATIGNAIPGSVVVPITVTGFSNIGAISLCFDYPFAGLHFIQGVPNPALASFAIGDQDLGNGKHRITMGWFGSASNLPNGSVIMTITFTYIGGTNNLEFYDNGPSCEYADASYNVLNDIPQSTYYLNGKVCGGVGNPGPIAGITSLCQGQTGVDYSVSPIANATGYTWTTPPGATIISGNNTNSIVVDFSPTAVSGNISVFGLNSCGNGPASQLSITVTPLPVADAGTDITIPYGTSTTLHAASGGSGSYSYHWSPGSLLVNPNIQDPQTVNLTVTTMFTVVVTNLTTLCNDSDEVVITISGGPLNTNPLSIPSSICRGTSAQLFANAGGGSGTYSYTWSCNPPGSPPWSSTQANPVVSPDSSKIYNLSVSDGFNIVQGSTALAVFQLPSATISGGDTLCGQGNSTILTVDLTGSPPWSFYYSNGVTTWFIPSQNTTPFFINATEPGVYTILAIADDHCTGTASGSAVVAVFPIPPVPTISISGSDLFSTGCCGNQWYKDGNPIPGATGQTFQPLVTAHYFDIVTVNGCSSDTSNIIYYLVDGIQHPNNNRYVYSVEPNPGIDFITIKCKSGKTYIEKVSVYSISGKREAQYVMNPSMESNIYLLDIRQLSPGLYFLEITSISGRNVLKLIVL